MKPSIKDKSMPRKGSVWDLKYSCSSHQRQITLRKACLHSSRAGRAVTGGKRKNPVKTITAVEPKPHYPTAAFTASRPSPSPKKKKKVKFLQSGIYLFQPLDGVHVPRGFVFFGPKCRICFSEYFHQVFKLLSMVGIEQTCLLSMSD